LLTLQHFNTKQSEINGWIQKIRAKLMISKFPLVKIKDFTDGQLNALVAWESSSNEEINRSVEKIIDAVKQNGDASVLDYTNQLDSL
jgi:hypothetical protein